MSDGDVIYSPVLRELVRRCERPNIESFVRAFERADEDNRATGVNARIVEMFEALVDEADQD